MTAPSVVDVNGLSLHDAAMRYAAVLGWHVFPIRPGSKDAPMTEHGQNDATTDLVRIGQWWTDTPDANIGIHCRPSGLLVSDLDRKPGIDATAAWERWKVGHGWVHGSTWHVQTPSGGDHFYYSDPEGIGRNTQGRIAPGIDTRGNGYVLAPPSVVDGRPYVAVCLSTPVAAHPALLLATQPVMRPATERAGPLMLAAAPEVAARVRRLCQEIADWPDDGTGNAALRDRALMIGGYVKAGQVDEEEAYAALVDAIDGWAFTGGSRTTQLGTIGRALREARPRPWEAAKMAFVGGEGIPFSAAPAAAPPLGQAGFANGAPPVDREAVRLAFEHPDVAGLTLPEEFWSARSVFGQIRQAAHARTVSGDVALYSTLARLAALWPHRVRADTGVKSPASLNLYVAIVGPSGAGKSSGISVAESLVPRPPWLKAAGGEHDPFADDVPLGTGEGIAEAYMGVTAQAVPQLDGNGDPLVYATGERAGQEKTKSEKVRRQVRHNLLVHADEGESLARMLQRSGATVGESLRRAWAGATIGQQNGRTETTRIVKSGQYSLGLLIGFQRETCQELLADGAAGTPQRFLWAWATDPSIPRYRVPAPSVLAGVWRAGDGNAWLIAGERETDERPVSFDEPIRDELFDLHHGLSTGAVALPELDAHMPLTKTKVAVLLAQLEGRRHVTVEDWRLAGIVWLTSCRVRDHLVAFGQAMRVKDSAAKRAAYAGQEAAAEVARHEVRSEVEARRIARVADRIAKLAGEAGPEGLPLGRLRGTKLAARDRDVFAEALDVALARLTVIVKTIDGTERVCPL